MLKTNCTVLIKYNLARFASNYLFWTSSEWKWKVAVFRRCGRLNWLEEQNSRRCRRHVDVSSLKDGRSMTPATVNTRSETSSLNRPIPIPGRLENESNNDTTSSIWHFWGVIKSLEGHKPSIHRSTHENNHTIPFLLWYSREEDSWHGTIKKKNTTVSTPLVLQTNFHLTTLWVIKVLFHSQANTTPLWKALIRLVFRRFRLIQSRNEPSRLSTAVSLMSTLFSPLGSTTTLYRFDSESFTWLVRVWVNQLCLTFRTT